MIECSLQRELGPRIIRLSKTVMSQNGKSSQYGITRGVATVGMLAGRSLLPLAAVIILGGTLLWGPWVTLILGVAWWVAGSFLG